MNKYVTYNYGNLIVRITDFDSKAEILQGIKLILDLGYNLRFASDKEVIGSKGGDAEELLSDVYEDFNIGPGPYVHPITIRSV